MSQDRILDDYDDVDLNLGALERAIQGQADEIKRLWETVIAIAEQVDKLTKASEAR